VCSNGLTITRDAVRAVHLGERMEEGIRWSGDTQDRQLALVTAKARDAVASFPSPGYAEKAVRDLEKKAGHPVRDTAKTVEVISARLRYNEAQQAEILDHFIKGGDLTAGGILHAVTSAAGLLPHLAVITALAGAAEHAGLPAGEVRRTIRSGMTAGMHCPRRPA